MARRDRGVNRIMLRSGYFVDVNPGDVIWNGTKWLPVRGIKVGDRLPVRYGVERFGSGLSIAGFQNSTHWKIKRSYYQSDITLDFMYIAGLAFSAGTILPRTTTITIRDGAQSVAQFLVDNGFSDVKRERAYCLSSVNLYKLFKLLELTEIRKDKCFPKKILTESTKDELVAFLRGIYDGDGCSNSYPANYGTVTMSHSSERFAEELQRVLLRLGIVSLLRRGLEKNIVGDLKPISKLDICGHFAHRFYTTIGFTDERRQRNRENLSDAAMEESGNVYETDASKWSSQSMQAGLKNKRRVSRRKLKKLAYEVGCDYAKSLVSQNLYFSPVSSIEEARVSDTCGYFLEGNGIIKGDSNEVA